MFSALRVAGTRFAVQATKASASKTVLLSAYRASSQPTVFAVRHFSTPPVFLDPAEVTERIISVVKNFDQVDANKVNAETKFIDDLGLDSLDVVEVVMAIEDEFAVEIPDIEADKISSIAEAVDYISTHPMAK